MISPVKQQQPSQPPPSSEHAPFSGRAVPIAIGRGIGRGIAILQINVEGISKAKTSCLSRCHLRQ